MDASVRMFQAASSHCVVATVLVVLYSRYLHALWKLSIRRANELVGVYDDNVASLVGTIYSAVQPSSGGGLSRLGWT